MSLLMLRTIAEAERIDVENGIIYGVKMIQKGPVKDKRGLLVTEQTLDQVLQMAQAEEDGVKARYGHPPKPGEDMLNRFLGRWKNFRRDGDLIRADLHLSKTAFKMPQLGDVAGYILELTQIDPRALGVSIYGPFADDFDGKNISLRKITAFDIVDEPAGTDGGMLSQQPSFEAALSELIGTHFTGKQPTEVSETVQAFLRTHFAEGEKDVSDNNPDKGTERTHELQLGQFDTGLLKEQGRIEERQRAMKITSLCTLSECPDKAAELIKGDFTYQEAESLVTKLMERRNAALSEEGGERKKPEEDPDAKYKEQYKADKEVLGAALAVSEEDYVASLKISESDGIQMHGAQ